MVVVVVSSSHQSPSLGVSLFRTALSITILLLVWSASKGSRKLVGVMRRMTAVVAMVARGIYSRRNSRICNRAAMVAVVGISMS